MPLRWVVCGAARGVGKTRLALGLAKVLPGAVYAKKGHGPRKPAGPENFFHTSEELDAFVARQERCAHLVLESNSWAREGRGDLVIYLDSGRPGAREDAALLSRAAHLRVAPGCSMEEWRETLEAKPIEPALREAVLALLEEQARHLGLRETAV